MAQQDKQRGRARYAVRNSSELGRRSLCDRDLFLDEERSDTEERARTALAVNAMAEGHSNGRGTQLPARRCSATRAVRTGTLLPGSRLGAEHDPCRRATRSVGGSVWVGSGDGRSPSNLNRTSGSAATGPPCPTSRRMAARLRRPVGEGVRPGRRGRSAGWRGCMAQERRQHSAAAGQSTSRLWKVCSKEYLS